MSRYLAERGAWLVVTLLGVSLLTFGLGVLAPGDPAEVIVERRLNQPPPRELVEAERRALGLDRPLVEQYLGWLGDVARGDLGRSWLRDLRVSDALRDRIPRTAALAGAAAALSLLIGVSLGVVSAVHRNSPIDHLCRLGALLGASLPSYFIAYLLIFVFAVTLRAVPVFGFGSPAHLVLPAVTLALAPASTLARLTRSSVLEILGDDYIRTAKAKGLRARRVLFRHALRNAFIPIVTLAGLSLGHLLGGALVVETVFAWPGLGDLAIGAIHDRDYPLIQGVVLFAGFAYVVVNFAIDLGYGWLDPRIRVGRRT